MGCTCSVHTAYNMLASGAGVGEHSSLASADSTGPPPPRSQATPRTSRTSTLDDSMHIIRLPAASGHTSVEDLEAELAGLPQEVRDSLGDLYGFRVEELQACCSRPLSLLAFATVREAARAVAPATDAYAHLPSLLGVLSRSVRKEGSLSQLHKLQVVQFLLYSTQPGGALYQLRVKRPLSVLALVIAALTYDCDTLQEVRKSVDIRRSMGARRSIEARRPHRSIDLGNLGAAGVGQHRTTTRVGRVTTQLHSLSVQKVLSVTRFFQALPDKERTELLFAVAELNTVRSARALEGMLEDASVLLFQDPDLFLLKSTLLLASFSHLLRRLKLHQDWCRHVLSKRRDTGMSQDLLDCDHAFQPGSHTNERFARCSSWVIDYLIVPLAYLWAQAADVKSAELVFLALRRASDAYKNRLNAMDCDVEKQEDIDPLSSTRSAFSADVSALHSSAASLSRRSRFGAELKLMSPFTHPNDVELPTDKSGIIAVCKMYNINAEVLYLRDVTAKEPTSSLSQPSQLVRNGCSTGFETTKSMQIV